MIGDVILHGGEQPGWLCFRDPVEIVAADSLDAVLPQLRRVEQSVNERRLYAAGFVAYEAAPAFDPALTVRAPQPQPLAWFGLYERVERIHLPAPAEQPAHSLGDWSPSVEWDEYAPAIARIKDYIAAGRTYQVNYTYRLRTRFCGDAWDLFVRLAGAQQANYAAYVDTGPLVLCSASPELFFCLDGRTLVSKPMKGTAPRGRTLAEDRAQQEWLRRSEKNRAENVMIVDMIRNDMGRVADLGSVSVPHLFSIERYPTVLQMTSTVACQTDAPLSQIMTALFPCASITGAPKVRTMRIIAELETGPRGVYTGCIGYLAPGRAAQFNVAIRTVAIDRQAQTAEYGVGGGIVWDSDAADEYRECQIKSRVLRQARFDFDVFESLLWTPDSGYFLLDQHVRRLLDSTEYFNIPVDAQHVCDRLAALSATFDRCAHKVRLVVSRCGDVQTQATPLDRIPIRQPVRLALAAQPVDSNDPFLYHKTTHRQVYDAARAARPGGDDVLLWNERGEITESTVANVVVEMDGALVTPPVTCGLLPGTFRAWLLENEVIRERVIRVDEITDGQTIRLINSVRKWIDAVVTTEPDDSSPGDLREVAGTA
jgi:para-aminobenzoate synthetase/4-amino-4-deoxychorismate lyase